jgi:hypothetical protein
MIRLPVQIDIGFSDIITPESVAIVYPAILGHPAPEFPAYNRETVIAEKFEATVKLGELNSRMKDFSIFESWQGLDNFAARSFRRPMEQTFSQRGTALVADPICFTEAFAMNSAKVARWAAFHRRNRSASFPKWNSSAALPRRHVRWGEEIQR